MLSIDSINSLISGVGSTYLADILPQMQANGNILLGGLATISISWFGIQMILNSGSVTDIVGSFVRQVFLIFLAFFFINDGFLLIFQQGIGDTLTILSEQLLFGSDVNDTAKSFFSGGDVLLNLINQIVNENSTTLGMISDLVGSLPEISALILLWGMTTTAGLIFFAIAIASQMMILIALSIGPIMIPWLVLPATAKWFDGWINFVVASGFWKILSSALLGIVTKIIYHYNSTLIKEISGGIVNFSGILEASITLLIALAASVFLFLQIPSIAGALTSGTGVSSIPMPRKKSGNDDKKPSGGGK